VEKDIALLITIEDNEARYDADTSIHGHFKCDGCGQVLDFKVEMDDVAIEELEGFQIDQKHIYYKGVCNNCLNTLS
jgi:Fe2+ or Zn2+ uptake regulation protein